jgi:hypothetical protein
MPADHRLARALSCALLALLATACQSVGAEALVTGRAAYNEVITRSGDEQLLALIVRDRYDETFGLLQVSAVTAQVEVGASTDVNVPVGPLRNFAENLVPFAAGASYTETPTISYVPLAGEALMTRLVAPVSLAQALTLGRLVHVPGQAFRLMVRRVNGHANALRPGMPPSPGFERAATLLARLFEDGVADIVGEDDGYLLLLHDADGTHREQVTALLEALGLSAFRADAPQLLIPVRAGVDVPAAGDAVVLETRSILDVLRLAGDALEVPEEHLQAGLAQPGSGTAQGAPLRIRSARERPAVASVAVRHRDWWFYVDATDTASKRGFVHLRALVDMGLDSAAEGPAAPVLTLPVGG